MGVAGLELVKLAGGWWALVGLDIFTAGMLMGLVMLGTRVLLLLIAVPTETGILPDPRVVLTRTSAVV